MNGFVFSSGVKFNHWKQVAFFILLCSLVTTGSFGSSKDNVLLIVHDREITRDEFLHHFYKNYQEINKQNITEYMELFINFQLKLAQAREEGVDHNIGFINELAEYRLLVSAPYLEHEEKEGEFVEELKQYWNFTENLEALEIIYQLADERVYRGNWLPPANQSLDEVLFVIDHKNVYQKDFVSFMSEPETFTSKLSIKEYINSLYQQFISARLIQYENYKLSEKYPEFRFQLEEYRDAMFLLAITRQEVWLKAESDKEGLEMFHAENRKEYIDEADKDVLADYQDYLMEKWIEKLRRTYDVQINEEVLSSLDAG